MTPDDDDGSKSSRTTGLPPIDVHYHSEDEKIAKSALKDTGWAFAGAAVVVLTLLGLFLWLSPSA